MTTTTYLLLSFAIAKFLDVWFTYAVIQQGGVETNPWVQRMMTGLGTKEALAVDFVLVVAAVAICSSIVSNTALAALVLFQCLVAANNISGYLNGPTPLGGAAQWLTTKWKGFFK